MRRRRPLLAAALTVGLVLVAAAHSAGAAPARQTNAARASSPNHQSTLQASPRSIADVDTTAAQTITQGGHEDVIARFASGRTIRAWAAVQENLDTYPHPVRAFMQVWATGINGNVVPGQYTVKGFHFQVYWCTASSCILADDFVRCTSGCTIRTTADDPIAEFTGSVWRTPYWEGYRTRADSVSGVILNTTDSTSNKCVSSYLVQFWPSFTLRDPSC